MPQFATRLLLATTLQALAACTAVDVDAVRSLQGSEEIHRQQKAGDRAGTSEQSRPDSQPELQDPDWPQGRRPRRGDGPDATAGRDPAARDPIYLAFAVGDGDLDLKDARGKADAGARSFRLRAGTMDRRGEGFGVDIGLTKLRRRAYSGTPGSTDVDQLDVYPFFISRVGDDGPFYVRVRIGPYMNRLTTERDANSAITTNDSIGVRFEAEPTLDLFREDRVGVELYARLSGGAHLTWIDDDLTGNDYDSKGTTLGFEPGVRVRMDDFEVGLAYRVSETAVRRSSYENGVTLGRTETEYRGFELSFALRF